MKQNRTHHALLHKNLCNTVLLYGHHTSRNSNREKVQLKVMIEEMKRLIKDLKTEFQLGKIKSEEVFELNVFSE